MSFQETINRLKVYEEKAKVIDKELSDHYGPGTIIKISATVDSKEGKIHADDPGTGYIGIVCYIPSKGFSIMKLDGHLATFGTCPCCGAQGFIEADDDCPLDNGDLCSLPECDKEKCPENVMKKVLGKDESEEDDSEEEDEDPLKQVILFENLHDLYSFFEKVELYGCLIEDLKLRNK